MTPERAAFTPGATPELLKTWRLKAKRAMAKVKADRLKIPLGRKRSSSEDAIPPGQWQRLRAGGRATGG